MLGAIIIVSCTALQAYWIARSIVLLRGSGEEIDSVMEQDLRWVRRVLLGQGPRLNSLR